MILQEYKIINDSMAADCEFNGVALEKADLMVRLDLETFKSKLKSIISYIIIACCSDALGVIDKMYQLTLEYVKTREQFGKKIGSFQVIQHRLVDMYIKKEEMRSLNYMAQLSFLNNAPENIIQKHISLNKIFLNTKANLMAQDCIQIHGGMGVANEMKIGHYLKRLTFLCSIFGDHNYHYRMYEENDLT